MTDALHYLTGFGGHFESEAVAGALPKGRNSPQRPAFGLYTEQLSGSSFTVAAAREPPLLAVPHAADGGSSAVRPLRRSAFVRAGNEQGAVGAQPAALGSAERSARRQGFRRRHGDDACQPRSAGPRRRRRPPLPREQDHGAARLCRRRRRAADHPAAGHASHRDRIRANGRRAGIGRAGPARREVPGRSGRRQPRLRRRESRPTVSLARARSNRLERARQPARFRNARRLVRGQGRADGSHPEIARQPVDHDARPLAARRRSPGTAITRHVVTTCRAST